MNGKHGVTLWKDTDSKFAGHFDAPLEAIEAITNSNRGYIIFPAFNDDLPLPKDTTLSRFLGKIALEAFVFRLISSSTSTELVESFVDDDRFDPLRDHVRRGMDVNWPCSVRRIYDANKCWVDEKTQEIYQVMNEFDFLLTNVSECYFVEERDELFV
ncbi:MAG: hypothetical protein Q7J27_08915 [Syntrophales bacterium]|nr:hypothetical protein [Syntrophales bacterium]